ncbi:uncharacterized protein L201_006937 [Kwoniella dendrophila CBS 6074]|uniref:BRCT domain-containing protein n=1 Tax=Kwoniella dendrophila CBS 6074 TaxID=1295534 RepID=A0AAX4K4F9_9TREE
MLRDRIRPPNSTNIPPSSSIPIPSSSRSFRNGHQHYSPSPTPPPPPSSSSSIERYNRRDYSPTRSPRDSRDPHYERDRIIRDRSNDRDRSPRSTYRARIDHDPYTSRNRDRFKRSPPREPRNTSVRSGGGGGGGGVRARLTSNQSRNLDNLLRIESSRHEDSASSSRPTPPAQLPPTGPAALRNSSNRTANNRRKQSTSAFFKGFTFHVHSSGSDSAWKSKEEIDRLIGIIRRHGGQTSKTPTSSSCRIILPLNPGYPQNVVLQINTSGPDLTSLEHQQDWRDDDLIRYYSTIQGKLPIGLPHNKRKIVLRQEWLDLCEWEDRVIGYADNYGGWEIKGTFDPQHVNITPFGEPPFIQSQSQSQSSSSSPVKSVPPNPFEHLLNHYDEAGNPRSNAPATCPATDPTLPLSARIANNKDVNQSNTPMIVTSPQEDATHGLNDKQDVQTTREDDASGSLIEVDEEAGLINEESTEISIDQRSISRARASHDKLDNGNHQNIITIDGNEDVKPNIELETEIEGRPATPELPKQNTDQGVISLLSPHLPLSSTTERVTKTTMEDTNLIRTAPSSSRPQPNIPLSRSDSAITLLESNNDSPSTLRNHIQIKPYPSVSFDKKVFERSLLPLGFHVTGSSREKKSIELLITLTGGGLILPQPEANIYILPLSPDETPIDPNHLDILDAISVNPIQSVVSVDWVHDCIDTNQLLPLDRYEIKIPANHGNMFTPPPTEKGGRFR